MMKQTTATILSSKWKLLAILFLSLVLLLMFVISIYLCFYPQSSYKLIAQSTNSVNSSSIIMNKFMQKLYNEITISKRRKRHLSNNFHSIVSLFNMHNQTYYSFQYNSSLENLTSIEFNLPVKILKINVSTIEIRSNQFHRFLQSPFQFDEKLLRIDLTNSIQRFPIEFSIKLNNISLESSGFLTLYFHEKKILHSKKRRDLSLLNIDNHLITYPDNPSYCQVRRYQTSFSDLNWTSWIVEPTSYEMNICSGHCQTTPQMPSYLIMQTLLHQNFPKDIPSLCCKPIRFAPTILLYYDGPNLILKRYENMRVIECGCS